MLHKILVLALLMLPLTQAFAQTDSLQVAETVIIKMNNGEEYRGRIIERDEERIRLETENGEINLIAANVKSVTADEYEGKFAFDNPNGTKYFLGSSAIPLKKGRGYYQNVMVVGNLVNYGITNNISIGGGFEFISTITGNPIWFLTPKAGFKVSDNVHVGGGFLMIGLADEGTATLGYGSFTLGDQESNLSLGVGYGYADGQWGDYPSIMISGIHRVSNSIALLSENYILPGDGAYFGIHGIRILSSKNSFDIGALIIPAISSEVPALPYVAYVRAF